ncbi:glycoside hydrolase superfamily [Massariosphaeria phaeospora]|uniref:Glycoside hydrolase superfamily n=1 Tax=Massariosphaeria phaeospora TaxID=100035 RepID=A0A7C8IBK2_9PLEO|nr:glycoside hydrolase superfamily [Massariosphaeria phaeospora]
MFATVFVFAVENAVARIVCEGTFDSIPAITFTAALHPGWNAGNTMDAIPDETAWGNPPLVNSTFAHVKNAGFNGVRLPVTWTHHMTGETPWTVDNQWLQRVSNVVDMITSNGLSVVINAHHDSWASFDLASPNANYTRYEEQFYRLWYQVGENLACKSSMVAFEPLNEPSGNTKKHAEELNKLHAIFLQAINDAGGFNSDRVVVLGGLGDNAVNLIQWLEIPENITNPYALTFHYYSPWDFTASAWGKTIWGSDADKAALEADFEAVRGNSSSSPIIVGEFGMEVRPSEPGARWKWFDHVVRTGHKNMFAMMLWDTSIHFVAGSPNPWEDPTALDILMNASQGVPNTLADSTEDGAASEQWSSATIFHRGGERGEPVADQSLPFIWNGNTLFSIESTVANAPRLLVLDEDYVLNDPNITFKDRYLSTLFQQFGPPGIKANLTLHFSSGAALQLPAIQWDTPQAGFTDFIVTPENVKTDLPIPFEYKGLDKLATVKARLYNSTYLIDEWTQWLGPLQQGRLTYQSHWDFNASHVMVKSSVLQAVLAAHGAAVLTFEFYPRMRANSVNFTLDVERPPPPPAFLAV